MVTLAFTAAFASTFDHRFGGGGTQARWSAYQTPRVTNFGSCWSNHTGNFGTEFVIPSSADRLIHSNQNCKPPLGGFFIRFQGNGEW